MRFRRNSLRHAGATALGTAVLLIGMATPAFAAHGPHSGGGGGGGGTSGGGGGSSTTGNDLSWPQCGGSFPSYPAFGIAGVNGGLANSSNPCFGPSTSYPSYSQSELYWALAKSTGVVASQPKASLYVNTGDPGNVYNGSLITDWPTSSSASDPYGSCTTTTVSTNSGPKTAGQNSNACAWQYGYNRAAQDTTWLTQEAQKVSTQESSVPIPSQASSYPWWLDVETGNSWQTGSTGQQMNVADLQGMVAALQAAGVTNAGQVGVYSTSYQWGMITGTPGATVNNAANNLWGLPDWVPGATSQSGAAANCSATNMFTGDKVTLTQWVASGLDGDYVCP